MIKKIQKKYAVMMEYVIIAVMIAAAVVVAVIMFGRTVSDEMNVATQSMTNAAGAAESQSTVASKDSTRTKVATDHANKMQKYDKAK